jgi:hypothetical protein
LAINPVNASTTLAAFSRRQDQGEKPAIGELEPERVRLAVRRCIHQNHVLYRSGFPTPIRHRCLPTLVSPFGPSPST